MGEKNCAAAVAMNNENNVYKNESTVRKLVYVLAHSSAANEIRKLEDTMKFNKVQPAPCVFVDICMNYNIGSKRRAPMRSAARNIAGRRARYAATIRAAHTFAARSEVCGGVCACVLCCHPKISRVLIARRINRQ